MKERKERLLAAGEAEVTPLGLMYMGKRYVCGKALRESWYAQAAQAGWHVQVWLEPDERALYIADGDEFERCSEAAMPTAMPLEQRVFIVPPISCKI